MRRDIRDTLKINDPRAKLRVAKAYLAARPCPYLIVTRALAKLAHQLPTHDASSAYHKSGFSHFHSLNFFKFYRVVWLNFAFTVPKISSSLQVEPENCAFELASQVKFIAHALNFKAAFGAKYTSNQLEFYKTMRSLEATFCRDTLKA